MPETNSSRAGQHGKSAGGRTIRSRASGLLLVPMLALLSAHSQSAPLSTRADAAVVDAGDTVDVRIFETPELSAKARVTADGFVDLPVAGPIHLAGLTPVQAGSAVEQRLREAKLMNDPHATVMVTEYATQGVTILGEVRNPGTYQLPGQHSLYGALSAAGGTTRDRGATITLTHRNDPMHPMQIQVDSLDYSAVQQSTEVLAGDTILVSRAATVYVLGDVGKSGEFPMQSGQRMPVLVALALAQGLNQTANTAHASIVRNTGDGVMTIPLNLTHLARNSGDYPLLQANDVLVVPRSGAKTFANLTLPGISGAVAGTVAAALIVR